MGQSAACLGIGIEVLPSAALDLGSVVQVVREKLYRRLHKELPYKLAIKLTQSEILRDGSPLFHFTILCPSEAVGDTLQRQPPQHTPRILE